ncbi:hypothetical protein ACFUN8_29750 [Streptomyces sp. NPDC057307]|uniref:hypothetical protein n=1 Tax=Streptomyces sp. NPDC057307 TaxID=3346096 RepID=UPI003626DEA8
MFAVKRSISRGLVAVSALVASIVVVPQASASTSASDNPVGTPFKVAASAVAETRDAVAANPEAAAAAATVCGGGYSIILYAERLPSASNHLGTVYTYTDGRTTGPNYNDKPVCAVFHNETGSTRYMGVRLNDNYTDTPSVQDFGSFSTYAGPVYQNKGYCGTVYSYMRSSSSSTGGSVVVDASRGSTPCN